MMLSMGAKSQIFTANSMAAGGQSKMGNANGADWQEEIYQKIKSMKEMYLSELNDLYTKIASKVQLHDNLPQHIGKHRMFMNTLDRIVQFLQVIKHDIQPFHKKKLQSVEKHISFFLNANRLRKPAGPSLPGYIVHTTQPTSIQNLLQPTSTQNLLQPTSIQPFQQAIMQPSAVQSPFLSNLQQNQQSTQSARLAHVEERLGMVEERLERIEARSQNVETLLVDINKTLNDLVKMRDVNVSVKVSGSPWTCYGRAKRRHRVAKMIRKSCQRRRLGRGAVEVVSPAALHDDCSEDVQRKPGEEQIC